MKKREICFGIQMIDYLGYYIEYSCLIADLKKISAVAECPDTRNVREWQSFLGLANYYIRFFNGFSWTIVLSTVLLSNPTTWDWRLLQQDTFNTYKNHCEILLYYNYS